MQTGRAGHGPHEASQRVQSKGDTLTTKPPGVMGMSQPVAVGTGGGGGEGGKKTVKNKMEWGTTNNINKKL